MRARALAWRVLEWIGDIDAIWLLRVVLGLILVLVLYGATTACR
jgi:hypothetical protein